LVEVAQGLLLDSLAACSEPRVVLPSLGELAGLFQVAGCAVASGTPPGLLFDGQVPDVPRLGAMAAQDWFLRGRRYQAIARHAKTLSITIDIPEG
jgi:hypothetical protein